jgi:hypothetical protein
LKCSVEIALAKNPQLSLIIIYHPTPPLPPIQEPSSQDVCRPTTDPGLSTAASFATTCREASKSERHPLRIARWKVRPIRKAVLAPARGFETGLDFFAYFFYQEKK